MHNWAMEAKIGKRIAKTKLALTNTTERNA